MVGVIWSFTAVGDPRLMATMTPAAIALPAPMTPVMPFGEGAAPGTPVADSMGKVIVGSDPGGGSQGHVPSVAASS
jgi:hypothetical protein